MLRDSSKRNIKFITKDFTSYLISEECVDKSSKCQMWKEQNFCHMEQIQNQCLYSCKMCCKLKFNFKEKINDVSQLICYSVITKYKTF